MAGTHFCCLQFPPTDALEQDFVVRRWIGTRKSFTFLERSIFKRKVAEIASPSKRDGFEVRAFLRNDLIRMPTSLEILCEEKQVVNKLCKQNVCAWTAIISARDKAGENDEAIRLYHQMRELNVEPDGYVFVAVLKACATTATVTQGRQIHMHIIDSGFESDLFVGSTLIHMYAKCGSLQDASNVFDRLLQRSRVTWNALIAGYAKLGHCQEALQLFQQMKQDGLEPDKVTFICVLKACSGIAVLEPGKQIHVLIIERGLDLDLVIGSTLVDLYAKCGRMQDARILFNRLPKQDVVTWSALIAGYAHEYGQEAFHIFKHMKDKGIEPTLQTFVSILKACAALETLNYGRWIHVLIIESGLQLDVIIGNALIDMYVNCGSLQDANVMFDGLQIRGVVTWSALIAGYVNTGQSLEALQIFQQMQNEGMKPDEVTFICVLKACSHVAGLQQGKLIHTHIIESGLESDLFVGSILVDMYAKCGSLEVAQIMFYRLPKRDVVTWTALIAGYVEHGSCQAALILFAQMQHDGIDADQVTFASVLKACSYLAALEQGKQIHASIIRIGLESEFHVSSALIDMYAKCGSLQDALMVFDRLPNRDVVTWSTLIAGYAQHNNYMMAYQCFEDMQQAGLKPDSVAFLCLLTACSHSGVLDKGCMHFKSMTEDHGIEPTIEHYTSMVDLFGHSGHLTEAEDLLETIPFQPNIVGWTSLLSSCRAHDNVEVGKRCFDHVITLDQNNAAAYVLMSKLYAHVGMWGAAEQVEAARRCIKTWKKPAKAFIEVDNQVHDFMVGDKSHPHSEDIYLKLKNLSIFMREEDNISPMDFKLNQTLFDEKEDLLCGHSEKLAIAFGLISTPRGATIRVSKNVRVCSDCHTATQVMSKIEMREIIVVDAYQVHLFKDGSCSCKDPC